MRDLRQRNWETERHWEPFAQDNEFPARTSSFRLPFSACLKLLVHPSLVSCSALSDSRENGKGYQVSFCFHDSFSQVSSFVILWHVDCFLSFRSILFCSVLFYSVLFYSSSPYSSSPYSISCFTSHSLLSIKFSETNQWSQSSQCLFYAGVIIVIIIVSEWKEIRCKFPLFASSLLFLYSHILWRTLSIITLCLSISCEKVVSMTVKERLLLSRTT